MTTRKLKWVGLGESEYVSKDGEFLVQLQDRTWHLFRRVEIEADDRPTWTWGDSLFTSKRKSECQDAAEKNPKAEAPEAEDVSKSNDHETRGALTNFNGGTDANTNARCSDCGVAFTKTKKWKLGDLCSKNCLETICQVLDEVDADLLPE